MRAYWLLNLFASVFKHCVQSISRLHLRKDIKFNINPLISFSVVHITPLTHHTSDRSHRTSHKAYKLMQAFKAFTGISNRSLQLSRFQISIKLIMLLAIRMSPTHCYINPLLNFSTSKGDLFPETRPVHISICTYSFKSVRYRLQQCQSSPAISQANFQLRLNSKTHRISDRPVPSCHSNIASLRWVWWLFLLLEKISNHYICNWALVLPTHLMALTTWSRFWLMHVLAGSKASGSRTTIHITILELGLSISFTIRLHRKFCLKLPQNLTIFPILDTSNLPQMFSNPSNEWALLFAQLQTEKEFAYSTTASHISAFRALRNANYELQFHGDHKERLDKYSGPCSMSSVEALMRPAVSQTACNIQFTSLLWLTAYLAFYSLYLFWCQASKSNFATAEMQMLRPKQPKRHSALQVFVSLRLSVHVPGVKR